jgi:hypothetical protein
MARQTPSHPLAVVSLLAVAGLLLSQVFASDAGPGAADSPRGRFATTETMGGEQRYSTHLSTDKPTYRPEETIHFRGVLLHQATHKPLADGQQVVGLVEIHGPKGDIVASGTAQTQDSVLGFSWLVPKEQAGGEYTAKVSYPGSGHAPAERKFEIRNYRPPRLKSQIKFVRDGYGPGDTVVASLEVKRAEGGVPVGAKVGITARVDGIEAYRGTAEVAEDGKCLTRFPLPNQIKRGEGTLAFTIEDGGVLETASKTIPILLQTVDLQLYPEGGELVAGFANRVYFEAVTPAKKPADLSGVVEDVSDADLPRQVAAFRSEHEGRGRFEFTPTVAAKYRLRITEPSGIATTYPLPAVKPDGVVLRSTQDTFAAQEPITVEVGRTQPSAVLITLAKREQVIARQELPAAADGAEVKPMQVKLSPDAGKPADGVLVVTAWDAQGKPLAERLIYRQPTETVNVKITADALRHVPGGKANLKVETTDGSGRPVSAVVGLTVTDDSVLEMIDKREQAPRLSVMVLLEDDVRELADAHVYLDPNNKQAPQAVDLLLGTQGWRRFALVDTTKFLEAHGDAGRRALALRIVPVYERERVLEESKLGEAFGRKGVEFAPRAAGGERPAALGRLADDAKADKDGAGLDLAFEQQTVQRQQLDEALGRANSRMAAKALMGPRRDELAIRNDLVAVRVYAHQVRPNRRPNERVDFTETLFWHAGLKTDSQGHATAEFGLNDSVTSFRVAADAFAAGGALGEGTIRIESVEPFYVEPKLPLEVTQGDRILLPLALVNSTSQPLPQVHLQTKADPSLMVTSDAAPIDIAADSRIRRLLTLEVGSHRGAAYFTAWADAGLYSDQVTRTLVIKPRGFPVEDGRGGLLGPGLTVSQSIEIPATLVPGSLSARAVVYPTPLASMNEALARLIVEPCGCFEQTSSTTYPLVMAQQYFTSHQGVDPSLIARSDKILETGYHRLLGFETQDGGFEWFGESPGHEALTAYGLLEFTDMARVRPVDPKMLERTRKWLLAQRDGHGGFARKRRALHTWIADPDCSNAYITWALLEAGLKDDLAPEVAWVREVGEKEQNTYVVALTANVMAGAGDEVGLNHLLDKLAAAQQKDGKLKGATISIVGSGGEALAIETTALAVSAWLQNPRYAANVEKSIQYLAENCKSGRFGSTQSTVLALRAIVQYDQSRAKPKSPGQLVLAVDGTEIGKPVPFTTNTQGAIELPDFSSLLGPGKHEVSVKMIDGSQMPYSMAITYNTLKPNSSRECKLHLEAKLRDRQVAEGEVTEANVVVVNRTGEDLPNPVAIIGIPGGLEVRHDQLKELVKSGRIAAYEVLGRDVVLYWRTLDKEQRVALPISLVAAVPGTYTGPASRAYLYYTDEHKMWVDGMQVEITPKAVQ